MHTLTLSLEWVVCLYYGMFFGQIVIWSKIFFLKISHPTKDKRYKIAVFSVKTERNHKRFISSHQNDGE